MSIAWKDELRPLLLVAGLLAAAALLPVESPRVQGAVQEGLALVQWYVREHVARCVVPALFIAGAIGVFVSQGAVMRFLGPGAHRATAYGVASVSGAVLAVCSCTVLPLFAGICRRGAGLGPAAAFLYAGPAINVLAVILTARVLGPGLGVARTVGAVAFSLLVGVAMHLLHRREEAARAAAALAEAPPSEAVPAAAGLGRTVAFFAVQIAVLVVANWTPSQAGLGWWDALHAWRWWITAALGAVFALMLVRWHGMPWRHPALVGAGVLAAAWLRPDLPDLAFTVATLGLGWAASRRDGELGEWAAQTWTFARQIIPLLLGGVLAAGVLFGRPGHEGLVPAAWIAAALGGDGLGAITVAAVAGALMYFATLTEIPIIHGLMASGMGDGPALALLLAGPALSLPSLLVLRAFLGWRKTLEFAGLVVGMAILTGWLYARLGA